MSAGAVPRSATPAFPAGSRRRPADDDHVSTWVIWPSPTKPLIGAGDLVHRQLANSGDHHVCRRRLGGWAPDAPEALTAVRRGSRGRRGRPAARSGGPSRRACGSWRLRCRGDLQATHSRRVRTWHAAWWSSTTPTDCMKAYIVVGPTKRPAATFELFGECRRLRGLGVLHQPLPGDASGRDCRLGREAPDQVGQGLAGVVELDGSAARC